SRRRHTRFSRDWSSDVCSSDLHLQKAILIEGVPDAKHRDWAMTLADLEGAGAAHLAKDPRAVDEVVAGIQGDHLATLIYTSGTRSEERGVGEQRRVRRSEDSDK